MENFAEIIKKLREEKNLTQKDLAQTLEMKTYTTITKWESGANVPKGKDIKRLAEFFSVSSDYLLGLTNERGSKINILSSQLKEERQNNVLQFTKAQLEEQNQEIEKQKIITLDNKNSSDIDDDGIDWNEWVAFDGRPMSDHDKQVIKEHLGDELKD